MNKNGWGLRVELFYIFLFLFCLLIATIGLNKLGLLSDSSEYDVFGNLVDDSEYKTYEENVRKAAMNYYNDKYINGTSDIIYVSLTTLVKNGYITRKQEENGKTCDGYAKIATNSNVASYIKCSKYKTSGYNSKYE